MIYKLNLICIFNIEVIRLKYLLLRCLNFDLIFYDKSKYFIIMNNF